MSPIDFPLFSLLMFETNPQIIAIIIIEARSGTYFKMSSKTRLTIAVKIDFCPVAKVPLITLSIFPLKLFAPKISSSFELSDERTSSMFEKLSLSS